MVTKNAENSLVDDLDKEYEDYKNSIKLKYECSGCHFLQGVICMGISLFSAARARFLWEHLKAKNIVKYAAATMFFSSVGIYKVSYAYHVTKTQMNPSKSSEDYKY